MNTKKIVGAAVVGCSLLTGGCRLDLRKLHETFSLTIQFLRYSNIKGK
ncbi:hypothetical protein P5775_32425 [Bacillus cereus]|nr:hypothetical protein [Bacillus cereus]MDF9627326.1 hypothetical protein [Bacillus cereus]